MMNIYDDSLIKQFMNATSSKLKFNRYQSERKVKMSLSALDSFSSSPDCSSPTLESVRSG